MPDLATFQHSFAQTLSNHRALHQSARSLSQHCTQWHRPSLARQLSGCRRHRWAQHVRRDRHRLYRSRAAAVARACNLWRGIADWIEHQPWASDAPYLSDVARFERFHIEALLPEDACPLTSDMVAAVAPNDWADVTLRLHPATRFSWATTPAIRIWCAHQNGLPSNLDLDWASQGALLVRPHWHVSAHVIDPAAHRFLFGIRLGGTVGAAALATEALYPHADIGGLSSFLVTSGAFAAPESQRNAR